jgi:GNAT superfamily N-acetyltransferase
MQIVVRDAVPDDAEPGSLVLRRSIAELCVADHGNDPAFLRGWLSNKTPDHFQTWIKQPGNSLLVAVGTGNILGVGSVTDAGEITLNYVSPDARFRGVSKALLAALEERAATRGCTTCTLRSSETARRFYLSSGYVEINRPGGQGARRGYPMLKDLALCFGKLA